MLLNNKIILNKPGVSLVDAFVEWITKSDPTQADLRSKYVDELLRIQTYEGAESRLTRYFMSMSGMGIGVDHELVAQVLDKWEDGQFRKELGTTLFRQLLAQKRAAKGE